MLTETCPDGSTATTRVTGIGGHEEESVDGKTQRIGPPAASGPSRSGSYFERAVAFFVARFVFAWRSATRPVGSFGRPAS